MNTLQTNERVDVIILSLVKDQRSLQRTLSCIDSYLNTAGDVIKNVFVVESNTHYSWEHPNPKVVFIYPDESFNYNKFYNIALERCEAEFVVGPNNDLVVHPNCIQALVAQFDENPNLMSLSPIDRNWHRHSRVYLPSEDRVYLGYETSLHMFGCVFMCRRSVFEQIGYLDERFFFFYQDNDYIISLQRLNLLHGVYTGAQITHESGGSNNLTQGRCSYTPGNMDHQGELFMNKWSNEEPFASGGYKQFKPYTK